MESINKYIEQNLIDFYAAFQDQKNIEIIETSDFIQIVNSKNEWPNFVLKKPDLKSTSIKWNELKQFNNDKNWILNEDFVKNNKNHIKQLGLFPLKKWSGMFLKKEQLFNIPEIIDFEISKEKTNNNSEIIDLINTTTFKKPILDNDLFKSVMNSPNLSLYNGTYKNKLVSTCLSYTQKNITGLYFIATSKAFRKKGFAKQIIRFAINDQIKIGKTKFVLHATEMGQKLYENLGFKHFENLIILIQP